MLFEAAGGLCLYLRLPGGKRLLVDGGAKNARAPLSYLRRCGEVGPLCPLQGYLRPALNPSLTDWLGVFNLLRGLVHRPGGAWLFWDRAESAGDYSACARVVPLSRAPAPPLGMEHQALLVLGLGPEEIARLGGPPSAWVANSSLAVLAPPQQGQSCLLGGDLRAGAWQSLLSDRRLEVTLGGVSFFAAGEPAKGYDLGRGLLMSCLPWLVMLAMAQAHDWLGGLEKKPRLQLSTPALGALRMDVDRRGVIGVSAWPRRENRILWRGLARPLADPALPAPWPLRRALA